uniref:Uncharacterized protein n=1 Tax=Anguilla anguilla TaxID=7936 RepID=A0A0E9RYA8_ANGAN
MVICKIHKSAFCITVITIFHAVSFPSNCSPRYLPLLEVVSTPLSLPRKVKNVPTGWTVLRHGYRSRGV